jgi:hypothetical protein
MNNPDVETPEGDGEEPLVPRGWVGEATHPKMKVARAVGFEPTIPVLETGALAWLSYAPVFVRIDLSDGPWGRNRTAAT